jgi:hypothetical protein
MKPNNAELKIRIPSDLKGKIEIEADAKMRTPSSLVRIILERYFYPENKSKEKK